MACHRSTLYSDEVVEGGVGDDGDGRLVDYDDFVAHKLLPFDW